MKKIIITLAILIPSLGFAQSELPQTEGAKENPFAAITTNHQVDQEYIDISQMAAILNIGNTTRSATRGATSLINIPREFIKVEQLTDGMEVHDQDKIKALLNK